MTKKELKKEIKRLREQLDKPEIHLSWKPMDPELCSEYKIQVRNPKVKDYYDLLAECVTGENLPSFKEGVWHQPYVQHK